MLPHYIGKVDLGQYVNIMDEDRLLRHKERSGFLQSAACVEQHVAFVGNEDVGIPVVGLQVVEQLVGVMMYVDNNPSCSLANKVVDGYLYQWRALHLDQGFGQGVCEGA